MGATRFVIINTQRSIDFFVQFVRAFVTSRLRFNFSQSTPLDGLLLHLDFFFSIQQINSKKLINSILWIRWEMFSNSLLFVDFLFHLFYVFVCVSSDSVRLSLSLSDHLSTPYMIVHCNRFLFDVFLWTLLFNCIWLELSDIWNKLCVILY